MHFEDVKRDWTIKEYCFFYLFIYFFFFIMDG